MRNNEIKRVFLMQVYQNFDFSWGFGVFTGRHRPNFHKGGLERIYPTPHDPIVITTKVGDYLVVRFLIDDGATTNLLYSNYWKQMNLNEKQSITNDAKILGFNEH